MQRVCLARAFALEPDLLLIDEPFNHLDAPLAADLLHSVKDYIAQCGITALFVTHNRDEALAMADRIGIMMGGSLRVSGAPREVFSAPGDVDVAAFVGIDNILPGAIEEVSEGVALVRLDGGGAIQAAGFEDGLSAGRRVYALIRPELVSLASSGGNGHTSVRNHFTGTVAELRSRGHNYLVRVECGFTVNALITALSFHELGLSPGAVVTASFKATAVALVPHYTKLHKYCP
jgi:molybdopterin-binding protein